MILRRRWNPEKKKRMRGLVRVLGYFSCVTVVCGVISVRHARAEYESQTLVFGRQMLDLAKASNHEVTKILFNGQPIHVGSSVTPEAPEQVLHRYEEYCKTNRSQSDDFASLLPKDSNDEAASEAVANAREEVSAVAKAGFVRTGTETDGAVVCFVKGAKTKATTAAAVESFLATGDLGAFGELRYAYASKAPSGNTLVLTVWADSTFNLHQMMADDGKDCAGEDFAEIPRLPGSTRILSARADGMPYGVNVYKTKQPTATVLEYYDGAMASAGWTTYDPEMTEEEHRGAGRAYMKNAVVVTLGAYAQPDATFLAVGLGGVAKDERIGRRVGQAD